MYTVYAVCASGIGTSLFARKLISDSIKELGYDMKDFNIGCIGMQEAVGVRTDAYITGESIAKNIPDKENVEKVIVVNMINDKNGMKAALEPVLKRAVEAGKISGVS